MRTETQAQSERMGIPPAGACLLGQGGTSSLPYPHHTKGRCPFMETAMLNSLETVHALVGKAHQLDEPIVVFDGEDECLVAMRPAVFERILFDTNILNCYDRAETRL